MASRPLQELLLLQKPFKTFENPWKKLLKTAENGSKRPPTHCQERSERHEVLTKLSAKESQLAELQRQLGEELTQRQAQLQRASKRPLKGL